MREFNTNLTDLQATIVDSIPVKHFDFDTFAEYETELNQRCKLFVKADSGVLINRRMRVMEVFSYGCRNMKKSLERHNLVAKIDNLWIVTGLISIATAAHAGFASNISTVVSDIFPKNAVGTVVGMSGFSGAIGGALAASFVALLLESTGSYFLIFTITAFMYLLVWAILKLMIPKIKPIILNNKK